MHYLPHMDFLELLPKAGQDACYVIIYPYTSSSPRTDPVNSLQHKIKHMFLTAYQLLIEVVAVEEHPSQL